MIIRRERELAPFSRPNPCYSAFHRSHVQMAGKAERLKDKKEQSLFGATRDPLLATLMFPIALTACKSECASFISGDAALQLMPCNPLSLFHMIFERCTSSLLTGYGCRVTRRGTRKSLHSSHAYRLIPSPQTQSWSSAGHVKSDHLSGS